MNTSPELIRKKLAQAGIHGPSSNELRLNEDRLTRYFTREYQRYIDNPVSLHDIGISTSHGPIMEETESLMDRHYDENLDFFNSFLDTRYHAYSMAYYGDTPASIRNSEATLEEAQHAKFDLIAERAEIEGHERVLDIGCGFGSLETYLLQRFPKIEIVGITPSKVQATYLRERMKDPEDPLGCGRFTLMKGTFDQLFQDIPGTKVYDLVITVALFEQVRNMSAILSKISSLIAPRGRTFHHFITSQNIIPQFLDPTKTRIGLYFPGGRAWPRDELACHTEHFDLAGHWFVNGLNYWRTLDEWHRRYWEKIPLLYNKTFNTGDIAHWNNYFSLCKAVFAPMDGNFYGNSHYLFRARH
jgi:cyclopropane-fatty-acyl-phospholipid synthase